MSNTSNLTELARFVGQSALNADGAQPLRRLIGGHAFGLKPKARPSVTELLGVVLTLSARTRRVVQPRTEIDLDVFAPGGGRAVRLIMPRS